jgi:hypothetical protein
MNKHLPDFNVILLHDQMNDKQGKLVTTSLTLIDIHDLARSCTTFGVQTLYIAHPSSSLRRLAHTLQNHWETGFGATYNPNRKEAIENVDIVSSLDEAIHKIDLRTEKLPKIIATSAISGGNRIDFPSMRKIIHGSDTPFLFMLGTGWGMSETLLNRADYFLEPINGPGPYNHLSVRSACAIMLDRLFGVPSPSVK